LDANAMYAAMARGGMEEGFDAVYDYITSNPYAATWMRPDAALLVVFVSDEEEQSRTFTGVSDFTSWYGGLRMGSVFLSSIVNHAWPDESVCTWTVMSRDVGQRYMDATNHFGGVVVDICEEDWSAGVTDAAVSVTPQESIALTHEPIEDSIRVFLDGALDSAWTYSASDNTVYFSTIPGPGVLVEVGYRYLEASDSGGDSGA
jgi:hypothetical protein